MRKRRDVADIGGQFPTDLKLFPHLAQLTKYLTHAKDLNLSDAFHDSALQKFVKQLFDPEQFSGDLLNIPANEIAQMLKVHVGVK